jgi:hypothetical protein
MRFAANGAHGYGNYFAVQASHSAGSYVHTLQNGHKGIFYCQVLIGEHANEVDGNRKMPPFKDQAKNLRYDSVGNETMFIVYTNTKAYPHYWVVF